MELFLSVMHSLNRVRLEINAHRCFPLFWFNWWPIIQGLKRKPSHSTCSHLCTVEHANPNVDVRNYRAGAMHTNTLSHWLPGRFGVSMWTQRIYALPELIWVVMYIHVESSAKLLASMAATDWGWFQTSARVKSQHHGSWKPSMCCDAAIKWRWRETEFSQDISCSEVRHQSGRDSEYAFYFYFFAGGLQTEG